MRLTLRASSRTRGRARARAFLAAGIEPGDRVAIWAPNIVGVGGGGARRSSAAGGVLVPINTRFKAAEAGYVLRKSGARLLCTVGEFLGVDYADSLGGRGAARARARSSCCAASSQRGDAVARLPGARRARADGARARARARRRAGATSPTCSSPRAPPATRRA